MAEQLGERENQKEAPPLTLDNTFEAVKRVKNWRKLGDRLRVNRSKLDAIQRQFDSDEARVKAMLEPFVLGKSSTYPSWRSVIDALYWIDEIAVARDMLTYAEAVRDPMTVENVTKVLNKIEGDKWRVMGGLDIPRPLLEEIKRRYSTDADQIHACADYFVNYHPNASWRVLTSSLHSKAELAAARESKSFMSTGDPTLTVDNVHCVIAKVESNRREQVWESMTLNDSIIDKIRNKYSSDLERETAHIDIFVNCDPRSSWEELIEALYKNQQEAALEEMSAYYQIEPDL